MTWATVDTNLSTGYRTARVIVATKPLRPVTKDIHFTIVYRMNSYYEPTKTIRKNLVIEAGQSEAVVDLYYSSSGFNQAYYDSEILIERGEGDGRFQVGRDLFRHQIGRGISTGFTNQPSLLMISSALVGENGLSWECYDGKILSPLAVQISSTSELPSLHQLAKNYDATAAIVNGPLNTLIANPQINGIHPKNMPEDWVGLSNKEQILISASDLKSLSTAQPKQRDALQRWTAAGGTLIVFDTGAKFESANSIIPWLLGRERFSELRPVPTAWRYPASKLEKIKDIISYETPAQFQQFGNPQNFVDAESFGLSEENAWQSIEKIDDITDATKPPKFLIGKHVTGRIVVVNDDMQQWTNKNWLLLQNAIQISGDSLSQRIGYTNANTASYYFSVPDVGQPPLIAFQVLIALFVFIAGPVMMIVLNRTKQLQLLFLLVPLLSLVSCLGLILYATFIDGFGTWGATQSVTWLDQNTGAAVSQVRAAYYCGLAPRPYSFGLDTVATIPNEQEGADEQYQQTSTAMVLSGGKAQPRTPHQTVSTRSFPCEQKLIWLPDKNSAGQFRNLLGGKIVYAAARTNVGLVSLENLPNESTGVASATDTNTISTKLIGLSQDAQSSRNNNFYRNRTVNLSRNNIVVNAEGAEFTTIQTLSGANGHELLEQPNTYIAIVETWPPLSEQLEPVTYKKQLHVIIGNW